MDKYKGDAARMWDDIVTDTKGYQFVDMWSSKFLSGAVYVGTVFGAAIQQSQRTTQDKCPGYSISNVQTTATGLNADLALAGPACNVYGNDVPNLKLLVNYDAGMYLALLVEGYELTWK